MASDEAMFPDEDDQGQRQSSGSGGDWEGSRDRMRPSWALAARVRETPQLSWGAQSSLGAA